MFKIWFYIVNELWTYLDNLYSRGSNLSRAHILIQELFKSKQKVDCLLSSMPTSTNFLRKSKDFPIIADVKEMQEKWNNLMVFVFLGALRLELSRARLNVRQLHCQVT